MKYKIQIPEPCSVDWNKMTTAERGRYCAVCEKEVLDFTQYSKQEIIQHLQKEGKVCGRMPSNLLDVYIADEGQQNPFRLKGLVATLVNLVALTTVSNVNAQDLQAKSPIEQMPTKRDKVDNISSNEFSPKALKKNIVEGYVYSDSDKFPLPGTSIILKGAQIGVSTDLDGKFELKLPNQTFDDESVLLVSFIGFENREIKLSDIKNKPVKIYLTEPTEGDVIITTGLLIIKKKRKWLFF